MNCPKCGDRSEVLQTIASLHEDSVLRRRRCLSPACQRRFKTREASMSFEDAVTTESVMKTLKLEKRPGSRFDAEAIAAALAVDKRRAQIKREQRRKAKEGQWENEEWSSERWDRAPRKLSREQLRQEMEGY